MCEHLGLIDINQGIIHLEKYQGEMYYEKVKMVFIGSISRYCAL